MTTTVSIRILDKEFQVGCDEDEVDVLMASAQELDRRMREIQEAGRVVGHERIAVMAALNVVADHHRLVQSHGALAAKLAAHIDEVLGKDGT